MDLPFSHAFPDGPLGVKFCDVGSLHGSSNWPWFHHLIFLVKPRTWLATSLLNSSIHLLDGKDENKIWPFSALVCRFKERETTHPSTSRTLSVSLLFCLCVMHYLTLFYPSFWNSDQTHRLNRLWVGLVSN